MKLIAENRTLLRSIPEIGDVVLLKSTLANNWDLEPKKLWPHKYVVAAVAELLCATGVDCRITVRGPKRSKTHEFRLYDMNWDCDNGLWIADDFKMDR